MGRLIYTFVVYYERIWDLLFFLFQAYADYFEIMDLCEELLRNCAQAVHSSHEFPYQEGTIDFGKSFRRASMHKLVEEELGDFFLSLPRYGILLGLISSSSSSLSPHP